MIKSRLERFASPQTQESVFFTTHHTGMGPDSIAKVSVRDQVRTEWEDRNFLVSLNGPSQYEAC